MVNLSTFLQIYLKQKVCAYLRNDYSDYLDPEIWTKPSAEK